MTNAYYSSYFYCGDLPFSTGTLNMHVLIYPVKKQIQHQIKYDE